MAELSTGTAQQDRGQEERAPFLEYPRPPDEMTAPKSSLDLARASFDRRAWGDAFDALARAEGDAPLDRDDLERLAWAAALRGSDEGFLGALERLHKACVGANETRRAARAAFWIGFRLVLLGGASGAAWLARAARLVEAEKEPCAERGYLLVPTAYRHLAAGEDAQAEGAAREAGAIGETCGDRDLVALARQIEGRALLRQGRIDAGLAVLDEVMLSVTSDELTPLVTGLVYCQCDRVLPGGLRDRSHARVDRGPRALVQGPGGARDVHGDLPRSPRRDHAARRRVA